MEFDKFVIDKLGFDKFKFDKIGLHVNCDETVSWFIQVGWGN
jgi:hypothetical protein